MKKKYPKRWINTLVVYGPDGKVIKREGYWYEGPLALAGGGPMAAWDQDSYAFYNDDGSESTATIIGSANTQQTLDTGTTYHCRLLIQETGGGSGNINTPEWEYNHNGAGWVDVTTLSSVIQAVDSGNLTNGDDTTQRLGSGTFITTNAWVREDGATPTLSFNANEECESVLAFQIVDADVSGGDEILLRMFNMDTYTREADIDVNKAAGAQTIDLDTPNEAIPSAESFGVQQLNMNIDAAGNAIPSAESVPQPLVALDQDIDLVGNAVASAESVPQPSVNFVIAPNSIASAESVPGAQLNMNIDLAGNAIASAEAIGAHTISALGGINRSIRRLLWIP